MGKVHVTRITTQGTIAVNGVSHRLENNVWIIGDEREAIVIDPAHDAAAVAAAVGERRVRAILLSHGHNDHIGSAREFSTLVDAPTHLHSADLNLWHASHPGTMPDRQLVDGDRFSIGEVTLHVIHTPGHTPGSVSLHAPGLDAVFTGDTLFEGGPGATRWDYSSFETIIDSITHRLLTLPGTTIVNTGHGPSTTIAVEAPQRSEWIERGY